MRVEVEWSYAGPADENIEFSRVLYAYLHPTSNEILYVGKSDYCTVRERLRGPHKEAIFSAIVKEQQISALHAIVGVLYLPPERRFSSELLADIESLLIMQLQPIYNRQSRQSRISRPSLVVHCVGDWPLTVSTFKDS